MSVIVTEQIAQAIKNEPKPTKETTTKKTTTKKSSNK